MQKINLDTFLFKGNPKMGPEQSYNSERVQLDKSNLPYFLSLSLSIYIHLTTLYKLRTQFNINLLKKQLSISYFGCHCHLKIWSTSS